MQTAQEAHEATCKKKYILHVNVNITFRDGEFNIPNIMSMS